jgi:hypothetical protein
MPPHLGLARVLHLYHIQHLAIWRSVRVRVEYRSETDRRTSEDPCGQGRCRGHAAFGNTDRGNETGHQPSSERPQSNSDRNGCVGRGGRSVPQRRTLSKGGSECIAFRSARDARAWSGYAKPIRTGHGPGIFPRAASAELVIHAQTVMSLPANSRAQPPSLQAWMRRKTKAGTTSRHAAYVCTKERQRQGCAVDAYLRGGIALDAR